MKKIKLSIGLFDKDTKKQQIDTFNAVQLIEKTLIAVGAAGLSVYTGNGVYVHDDGTLVREPSVFVDIYNLPNEELEKAIVFLKKELNQESIAVESSTVNVKFL